MPTADDGLLFVQLDGAAPEALERGLAAARSVFEAAGADPEACALASFRRDSRDAASAVRISQQEHDLADLWWEAAEAAWLAVAPDWEDCDPGFGLSHAVADGARFGSPFMGTSRDAAHRHQEDPHR